MLLCGGRTQHCLIKLHLLEIVLVFNTEMMMWVFSVLVANLTVISTQSRQFPTVLLPGHVHSNKLISLLGREEQQEPRKRRHVFYSLEEESGFDSQREE